MQRTLTTPETKTLFALKHGALIFVYIRKDKAISGQYVEIGRTKKYLMRIVFNDLLNEGLIVQCRTGDGFEAYTISEKGKALI